MKRKMHDITNLPAWERLFKKIVWKQLGDMEGKKILDFEKALFEYVDTKYPEVPEAIRTEKVISDETEAKLVKAIEECKADFLK